LAGPLAMGILPERSGSRCQKQVVEAKKPFSICHFPYLISHLTGSLIALLVGQPAIQGG